MPAQWGSGAVWQYTFLLTFYVITILNTDTADDTAQLLSLVCICLDFDDKIQILSASCLSHSSPDVCCVVVLLFNRQKDKEKEVQLFFCC